MKRKRKLQSIQKKLFLNYTILITVTIILFLLTIYSFNEKVIMEKASESLYQTANAIANEIDMELSKANDLQKRILFSQVLQELIFSDSIEFENGSVELQRKFNEYGNLVSGPEDYRKYQLNMMNTNGNIVGIGYNSFIKRLLKEEVEKIPYLDKTIEVDGKKIISKPYQTTWANREVTVISLYRSFCESNSMVPTAIMETQIDFGTITPIIQRNLTTSDEVEKNIKIVIYNDLDELIFTSDGMEEEEQIKFYIQKMKEQGGKGKRIQLINPSTDKKEVLSRTYIPNFEWTIVAIEEEDSFLKPVTDLKNTMFIIGIIVLGASIFITYQMARKIANPIKDIYGSMKTIQLENISQIKPKDIETDVLEIEELNNIFIRMCEELRDSLDVIVSIRTHEIQAKLMALQAQMDPHFLYNTLATIQIMAKEAGEKDIVNMCANLSDMLRYVSNSDTKLVTLKEEWDYTMNYMELMKIRHQDRLIWKVELAGEMLAIKVPRLILQPLVENSIKYVGEVYPPWKVGMKGSIVDNKWKIEVSDNGLGIDETKKMELKQQFASFRVEDGLPNLHIDGMGLMNIYTRLTLLYNAEAIFDLEESDEGGMKVIIGGLINE